MKLTRKKLLKKLARELILDSEDHGGLVYWGLDGTQLFGFFPDGEGVYFDVEQDEENENIIWMTFLTIQQDVTTCWGRCGQIA